MAISPWVLYPQVIGAGVFGVILVTVSSLAEGDPLQFAENSKLFELKSFMRHYKLPRLLRKKVRRGGQDLGSPRPPLAPVAHSSPVQSTAPRIHPAHPPTRSQPRPQPQPRPQT